MAGRCWDDELFLWDKLDPKKIPSVADHPLSDLAFPDGLSSEMLNKLFKAILSKFLNIHACSCLSSRRHRRIIANIFCIILILISGLATWLSFSLWKLNAHPWDSQVTISVKAEIQKLEQPAWWQDVTVQVGKTRQADSSLGSPHWSPAPSWDKVELLFHNQTCALVLLTKE